MAGVQALEAGMKTMSAKNKSRFRHPSLIAQIFPSETIWAT
jgi:hypothetical protein